MQIFSEGFTECDTNAYTKIKADEILDDNLMRIVGTCDYIENQQWFQSNVSLKGFKDSCVNGKSVSDSWLKSCQGNVMAATKNVEDVNKLKSNGSNKDLRQ